MPIRAIVKGFMEETETLSTKQAPQLWDDLQALRSIEIFVCYIHMGNYLGGKLVDLSLAWTMYNPALEGTSHQRVQVLLREEVNNLAQLIYH